MGRSTVGLGIWAAIGPLIGIALGHSLNRSSQHEQWLRDNRKQEYRDLLTSLTTAYLHLVHNWSGGNEEPVNEASRVLHDRIFIAQEIRSARIMEEWGAIVTMCKSRPARDMVKSGNAFSNLTAKLANMALSDPRRDVLGHNRGESPASKPARSSATPPPTGKVSDPLPRA